MKLFVLSLLSLSFLTTGCATMQQRQCDALTEEYEESGEPCADCLGRLTPVGLAASCQYVCGHGAQIQTQAVAACMPEVPAASAPAASSSSSTSSETSADSSQP